MSELYKHIFTLHIFISSVNGSRTIFVQNRYPKTFLKDIKTRINSDNGRKISLGNNFETMNNFTQKKSPVSELLAHFHFTDFH